MSLNLDLFHDHSGRASLEQYELALRDWLAARRSDGQLRQESSVEVYEHMWAALAQWAVGQGVAIDDLAAEDLQRYLNSRGGSDELSNRYAARLLSLIDRVLMHRAHKTQTPPNTAVKDLLARRADLRFANSGERDGLPEFLHASQAKQLVTFLSAVRPGRTGSPQSWQEVRNRASVGLMLGSGITPGEVRALTLDDVYRDGGRSRGLPWKLRVPGNGNSASRETPIAPWAGHLLAYWLSVRAEQSIPGKMLFPSTRSTGKPWGKVAQYTATREVLEAAGFEDTTGGSFQLRHTFALRQLRRGTSPDDVARWLGVSDPQVMARYQRVLPAPVDVV